MFEVEASLWHGHPDYEPLRFGEWTCYKPARLVFEGVESVSGLPEMKSAPRSTDADGGQDFGSFSELTDEPGGFVVAGDFGVVRVRAVSARLAVCSRIEPPSWPTDLNDSDDRKAQG